MRIPLGYVADHDYSEMITYYLKKDQIPYDKYLNFDNVEYRMSGKNLHLKPKDIEMRLLNIAKKKIDYGGKIDEGEIKEAFINLSKDKNDEEILQFDKDKIYADKLGGTYKY